MTSGDNFAAFAVGAVNSGSGKTTVTLALLAALRARGLRVAPFKCGPDYIDPLFHAAAAGEISHNLDPFLMTARGAADCFAARSAAVDAAVVEGVMGLFDGFGADTLAGSTAELAGLLKIPVVLVVNAHGLAGSIAPLVKGFVDWRPELPVAGVIANLVGSGRHAELLRDALHAAGLPPLLGAFRRDAAIALPERHLGLATEAAAKLDFSLLAAKAEAEIELDRLLACCRTARPAAPAAAPRAAVPPVRLGVARDEAFQFYYEENFRLLREQGVETVFFSPLHDRRLPERLHGLYLGGGYPELHAEALSANTAMLQAIRAFAAAHPVYGECGGYLYLLEALIDGAGRRVPLAGLLPGEARMGGRLAALGYRKLTLAADGLFGPAGTELKGHEFHYSAVEAGDAPPLFAAVNVRGAAAPSAAGAVGGRVAGSYAHVHFASAPEALSHWVEALRQC